MKERKKRIDLTGQRFGRLVVLARSAPDANSNARWSCMCDCGTARVVYGQSLGNGATQSCGCLAKEPGRRQTHGASSSNDYKSWAAMVQRCTNPNNHKWPRYGGRGITVCERWRDYENFLADMGPRPSGMTLDRYPNNDGNYEPGNCRWATPTQQQNNTSFNKFVTVEGERLTYAQAARKSLLNRATIRDRISRGWDAERAFTTPARTIGKAT